jgi:hypothetical protein|tara:strand:+ start:106 stop:498 length:393 start_codon:yes stop_codon:yes gene_type:complete
MVTDPVSSSDIDHAFELIEPYLARLTSWEGTLEPLEIYRMLENGSATLHLITGVGFMVCQWTPGVCHVLIAAAYNLKVDSLAKSVDLFSEYVRKTGTQKITFTSPRPAWSRLSTECGFKVESVNYSKVLL